MVERRETRREPARSVPKLAPSREWLTSRPGHSGALMIRSNIRGIQVAVVPGARRPGAPCGQRPDQSRGGGRDGVGGQGHWAPGGPGHVLAPGAGGTLYLPHVPYEVVRWLERLALRDGAPVEAVAVGELAAASRRADNPVLLGSLPDLGVGTATIVGDLAAGPAGL